MKNSCKPLDLIVLNGIRLFLQHQIFVPIPSCSFIQARTKSGLNAEGGTWTHTRSEPLQILSLPRLPISPLRLLIPCKYIPFIPDFQYSWIWTCDGDEKSARSQGAPTIQAKVSARFGVKTKACLIHREEFQQKPSRLRATKAMLHLEHVPRAQLQRRQATRARKLTREAEVASEPKS